MPQGTSNDDLFRTRRGGDTPDGHWCFVGWDVNDALTRQQGVNRDGTWSLVHAGPVGGPLSVQVTWATVGGMDSGPLVFQERPTALRLKTTIGFTDYVAFPN